MRPDIYIGCSSPSCGSIGRGCGAQVNHGQHGSSLSALSVRAICSDRVAVDCDHPPPSETKRLTDWFSKSRRAIASSSSIASRCSASRRSARTDRSAENLAHYLAIPQRDLRGLQERPTSLGLSSLGRSERNFLWGVQTLLDVIGRISERDPPEPSPSLPTDAGFAPLSTNAKNYRGRWRAQQLAAGRPAGAGSRSDRGSAPSD